MAIPFELTAAAAEDPRLEERLRAESEGSRAALLAEADRLRGGNDGQRRLALVVYRALHADVDPTTIDGSRRAAWVIDQLRSIHPAAAAIVRRTAAGCADDSARLRAAALSARYAEREGDPAGAERILAAVMREVRGTGTTLEFGVLEHAARIAADHEDCARALALAATALALPSAAAPAALAARAHRCRADAFGSMRDAARCERELRAAQNAASRAERRDAEPLRAEIAASRAAALLRRGLAAQAVPWIDQSLECEGDEGAPGRIRWAHVLGARTMLDLGRTDAAARHVARALRIDRHGDVAEFELELVQVRLQRAAGGPASARPRAAALVARLAGAGRRIVGPGLRTRLATDLAQVLGELGGDVEEARRAYDLAASSLVETIARVDRDIVSMPELGTLPADDLDALREHRDREQARRSEVQATVARFFDRAARESGPAFLARLTGRAATLTVCAWCGRIRGSDGRWLPVGHVLPGEETLELSHAACETCFERTVRALRAAPAT